MSWECPLCGESNDDKSLRCFCGFEKDELEEERSVSFFDSQRMEEMKRLDSNSISEPEYSYNNKNQSMENRIGIVMLILGVIGSLCGGYWVYDCQFHRIF